VNFIELQVIWLVKQADIFVSTNYTYKMRILWDELRNFQTVPSYPSSASRFCNVFNTIQKFQVMMCAVVPATAE
jgi:hypothetical protein